MKMLFFINILILFGVECFSQKRQLTPDSLIIDGITRKCYFLSEALKVHPDSVFILILSHEKYKGFPKEILKFKNLTYIDFGPATWATAFFDYKLSPDERKYYIEVNKIDTVGYLKKWFFNPSFNGNKFEGIYFDPELNKIPKEFFNLKKLNFVAFVPMDVKCSTVKKLKRKHPGITINVSCPENKSDYDREFIQICNGHDCKGWLGWMFREKLEVAKMPEKTAESKL